MRMYALIFHFVILKRYLIEVMPNGSIKHRLLSMISTAIGIFAKIFTISFIRYLVFAGAAYLFFYVWKKEKFLALKIQQKFPTSLVIRNEFVYSVISILLFSLVGLGVSLLHRTGYTKIYETFSDYGWGYFLLSTLLMILAHDTYFYWMHRLIHDKRIYKYVHKVHHQSINPTPWAAFSFHPTEAILEVGILPIMVFLIPLHPLAIITWILFMTFMNVLGHLGFEIFKKGFVKNSITRWSNTSVHHNMHHKYAQYNYGLYFNFWDWAMKTNHPEYIEEFNKIAR